MKYKINKTNYRDFGVISENTLEPRSYFVPFSSFALLKNTDFRDERKKSDKAFLLSGEWDFRFYKDADRIPSTLNTDSGSWDKITVPCTWQRTGYSEPVYLNCPYEFKTVAPALPEKMPGAVYRRFFTVGSTDKVFILSFLGVANNADVYVNGEYAGYREGTHNTAEYDISALVKKGENELVVVMRKWCTGSFLEAQDMFRENGIQRDVLLYECDKTFIRDYSLVSVKKGRTYDLGCTVDICGNTDGCKVRAYLVRGGEVTAELEADASAETKLSFKKIRAEEWSAEIPNVYEVYFSLEKDGKETECVRQLYGFRTIEIACNVYLWNGQNIKMKGVNHHDTHLTKGYAIGTEDYEKDVRLMKEFNVNAVRTSHYPPDPVFHQLATVYGIYVADEADIETHGCSELYGFVDFLSMSPAWIPRYVDRVRRMYRRDRNNCDIALWSLGNESGGYVCHDACYDFIKSAGSDIPVFYEGVSGTKRFAYDVSSEMYTSIPELKKMAEGKHTRRYSVKDGKDLFLTRPFFMCEYAHAMGVGPGNLKEYWDEFYRHDFMMGGCIWEWADHTVLHENDKYKYKYTYGGDHGEPQHDGHFCVDGLFYADRRPHTGALEMKAAYRPVLCEAADKAGRYVFTNTNRFRSSGYLRIVWELLENGEVTDSGEFVKDIAPKKSAEIRIAHKAPCAEDAFLNISYYDGDSLAASEQLVLSEITEREIAPEYSLDPIGIGTAGGKTRITFANGYAEFGEDGNLAAYNVGGRDLANTVPASGRSITANITRAFIDNDNGIYRNNRYADFRTAYIADSYMTGAEIENGVATVYRTDEIRFADSESGFDMNYEISFDAGGKMVIRFTLTGSCIEEADLPVCGFMFEMPRAFDNVKYYGRGEAENMPDFTLQAPVGVYSAKVADMDEPYVFPQDSGVHCDCRYLEVTDESGHGLRISCNNNFAFSAHNYTQAALQKAAHREDLADENTTVLSLNAFVRGIGSSSCGPDTLDEYKLKCSAYGDFFASFEFIPV